MNCDPGARRIHFRIGIVGVVGFDCGGAEPSTSVETESLVPALISAIMVPTATSLTAPIRVDFEMVACSTHTKVGPATLQANQLVVSPG